MGEQTKIPAHVAIIMDGNGRWAESHGRERAFGHAEGVNSVKAVVRAASDAGVRYLTLYTFSTENWGRPQAEVEALMDIMCRSILENTDELVRQGVRARIIGDREGLPARVVPLIEQIESRTAAGEKLTLILAINYSSRSELARAARNIARRVSAGAQDPERISAEDIAAELHTAPWPEPDLLVRTGGEERLSNFLLWQVAYAELYFTPTMWPDFREAEFDRALEAYAARSRRYGLVNEQ